MGDGVYLDLDGAWEAGTLGLPTVDARVWGPKLRYHATARATQVFYAQVVSRLPRFVLYGSGDFHHLSASFVRRWAGVEAAPITLISFDNHPDWDIRPPRWACGGWINRAVELPNLARASIWGCGNFELAFPSRLFRNRAALKTRKIEIHAWSERQSLAVQRRFNCMTRDNWRNRFASFVETIRQQPIYLTVDLDCLRDDEIITNWENGLFTASDIAWAIKLLREKARLIAADVCGSRSTPVYARRFQRFAGHWDHPKLPAVPLDQVRRHNLLAVQTIWQAIAG